MKDKITMSKRELFREHKRLVRVLRKGTKASLEKEAKRQEKEMKEYGALRQH